MLIDALSKLGPGAKIAKADFENLGFTSEGSFYVNVTMPMGAKVSCAKYEKFSTFLEHVVKLRAEFDSVSHYLDDFIFWGPRILISVNRSRQLLTRSLKSSIYQRQKTRKLEPVTC